VALPRGHVLTRRQCVTVNDLKGERVIIFPRRVAPGLDDAIIGMCRNAGFSLNAVHETDNVVASLTLVSAELGVAFCTPSIRRLWPDLVFRPISSSVPVEQAVAYRQDLQSPVVRVFLQLVRKVVEKQLEA